MSYTFWKGRKEINGQKGKLSLIPDFTQESLADRSILVLRRGKEKRKLFHILYGNILISTLYSKTMLSLSEKLELSWKNK